MNIPSIYLVEPYNAYAPQRKKHWMEEVEEQAMLARIIAEQQQQMNDRSQPLQGNIGHNVAGSTTFMAKHPETKAPQAPAPAPAPATPKAAEPVKQVVTPPKPVTPAPQKVTEAKTTTTTPPTKLVVSPTTGSVAPKA